MKKWWYCVLVIGALFTIPMVLNAEGSLALSCFCQGDGHLESLKFSYNGEDCSASSHSQNQSEVVCNGDPDSAPIVRVIASTKLDPGHKKYTVTFDENVNLDSEFLIFGTQTKHGKISPHTIIKAYSQSGELLQTVQFHTSCSQPLNPNDQFGSFVLTGGVRESESIVDACGICGGDGTSCIDCLGIPNGQAKNDSCGVCNGNNDCLDCESVPYGYAKLDQCGVCNGSNDCLDCTGEPFGKVSLDSCEVCGGSNQCLDCLGVPNGNAQLDSCGVCNGDNSCLDCPNCDCAGTPGGILKVDACGVCGGSDECLDCAGAPFGTAKIDNCGTCNGKDECLDCEGAPFGLAQDDRCGVCNGDGDSCVECNSVNLAGILGELDGGGFAMKSLVLRAMKDLRRAGIKRKASFKKKVRQQAVNLYKDLWKMAYSFPMDVLQCSSNEFCVEVSQSSDLEVYRERVSQMKNLYYSVANKGAVKSLKRKQKKKLKRLDRKFSVVEGEVLGSLDLIPTTISLCS